MADLLFLSVLFVLAGALAIAGFLLALWVARGRTGRGPSCATLVAAIVVVFAVVIVVGAIAYLRR